jgi:hypothetical protein
VSIRCSGMAEPSFAPEEPVPARESQITNAAINRTMHATPMIASRFVTSGRSIRPLCRAVGVAEMPIRQLCACQYTCASARCDAVDVGGVAF